MSCFRSPYLRNYQVLQYGIGFENTPAVNHKNNIGGKENVINKIQQSKKITVLTCIW